MPLRVQQALHEGGLDKMMRFALQIEMFPMQSPGKNDCPGSDRKPKKLFNGMGMAVIVGHDISPFDTANNNVLQKGGNGYGDGEWHGGESSAAEQVSQILKNDPLGPLS